MAAISTVYGLNESAALLGLAVNTLKSKVDQGLPIIQRGAKGKPWQISIPDAVAWLSSNQSGKREALGNLDGSGPALPSGDFNLLEEQARERHHKANIAEMKAAEMAGDLVDRNSVRHACEAAAVVFRTGLENAGPRLAQKARSAATSAQGKTAVQAEITLILKTTSDGLRKAARVRSDADMGDDDE